MKKIISIIMVFVMSFVFCSCSGKAKTNNVVNGVSYSEPGKFPITTEPIELTVWAILSSEIDDYETNYQSEWYENYSGVKIHWINVPAQGWANSFQTSVMSGEYPDIYLYDFSTEEVNICKEYDVLLPLDDLIEENCPNIKKMLDENQTLRDTVTSNDGKMYTLFSEQYNQSAYTQKLWVNKSWLETYKNETGKEMPSTTDDFCDMLKFFKDNDMNGNGDKTDEIPYMGKNGLDGIYNLCGAFIPSNSSAGGYGCYINSNGEISFSYDKNEFRNALKYINNLYSQGLISDQTFTINDNDRYQYTSLSKYNNKVGVTTGVNINNIVQLSSNEDSIDYSDYVAIPPLEGPDGFRSFVTQGETSISLKNAITTSCKYPEIAAKWLDYWYSEEGRLWSVNGGLENEHWYYESGDSLDGVGKIVSYKDDVDVNDNFCWAGQGVAYMITADDFLHMNISSLSTNSSLATYLADREYSKYAINSGWPALVWTSTENKDAPLEYSELRGLIEDYVTKSYTDFVIGNKNINDDAQWNAYVDELNNIGLDRFIELVNMYIENSKR